MTRYVHGESDHSKLAALHLENRDLRHALTAALNDLNQWRDLFYESQGQAEDIEADRHGKTTGYDRGCRCAPCSTAQREKSRRAYQRRKQKQT